MTDYCKSLECYNTIRYVISADDRGPVYLACREHLDKTISMFMHNERTWSVRVVEKRDED